MNSYANNTNSTHEVLFDVCLNVVIYNSGPFSQRVLLTLEEKHLPYDLKLIDFANKPDW